MIVITGGSDGLGKELVLQYKQAGIRVVNVALESCPDADVNIVKNLADPREIDAAAAKILEIEEPITAIIHSAGVWTDESVGRLSDKEFDRVFGANVKSVTLLTSRLLDHIKQYGTDIALVCSTAGLPNSTEGALYTESKWAVRGFADILRRELQATASRVITFCPDGFDSSIMEKYNRDVFPTANLMPTTEVARLLKTLLGLPKSMEVEDIVVRRKTFTV
jgi:NAD(P)-dependent dehydrogenase (short-subunit alcohol dehydrogenase family)